MTSHERVKLALEHKEPDRVPFDIGGTSVTQININALRNLRRHVGLSEDVDIQDTICQTGVVTDDIVELLSIDVRPVFPNPASVPSKNIKSVWEEADCHKLIDEFGIGWKMPKKVGHFFDIYKSPFGQFEEPEEVLSYPWPDGLDDGRFVGMKERADKIVFNDKRAYVLERMSAGMWETAMWMTGYEKFYCDMVLNPELIEAIMDKMIEVKMNYWGKALDNMGENALVISEADDLGTQNGLVCSLELYKKLIWPYHKKLFEFIKKRAKSKVYIFFHCDGSCFEAIPLLIEAGVDILNPVQVNCRGMDTKHIKREFGKDLSFWGALCDSQSVLPYGSVEQVKEETKRRVEDCMKGGGFIAAPIHNILGEVPPENIMAMWETLNEYGKYS